MSTGRHRARRRRPPTTVVAAGLVAVLLALVQIPGARGAFVARITNTADTAASATYFTCQAAEQGDASTSTIFTYPLSDSASSSTAADTSVNTPKKNGTYAAVGVTPGTANAAPAVCPRDGKGVATFTGSLTGGYVTGPATATTAPASFSIEVWFRTTTASGRLIGFSGTLVDDRHLYIGGNGTLNFGITTPALARTVISSTATVTDGAWHDAIATFSTAGGMALYLDGKLQAANGGATAALSYTGTWRLGNDNLALWPNAALINPGYFTGAMAFAAAYATVLSPDQVAAHYRAGT